MKIVTDKFGNKKYYNYSRELHRIDGPAVEYANGTKIWYLYGKRHRVNGPAAEYESGDKEYYINGVLHRIDGPAIETLENINIWYYNGIQIPVDSQEEFERYIKLLSFI